MKVFGKTNLWRGLVAILAAVHIVIKRLRSTSAPIS